MHIAPGQGQNNPWDKGHLWIKWEFSLIDKYVTFKDAKAWLFVVSVFWHILKVSDTIHVGFNIFLGNLHF